MSSGRRNRIIRLEDALKRIEERGGAQTAEQREQVAKINSRIERLRGVPGHQAVEVDWRAVALHLADCHAATTENQAWLSSTSKRASARMRDICAATADLLEGKSRSQPVPDRQEIVRRLRDAAASRQEEEA